MTNGGYTLTVGGSGNTLLSGVVGGNGGLTKTGNGTLTLTSSGTYFGNTTISGGALQLGDGTVGHDGSLGGSYITNNASLIYNLAGSQTYSYAISGSGNLTKTGTGTLVLNNNNTYTGSTTISGGTLQFGDINYDSALPSGNINIGSNGALVSNIAGSQIYYGSISNNGALVSNLIGSQTFQGSITGTGSLIETGNGNLYLNSPNTFSGLTIVNGGNLNVQNSGALQWSTVTPTSGYVFLYSSGSFGGLGGSGSVDLSGYNLTVGGNNASTTFTGMLRDDGYGSSLTKAGTGTLTLAGSNSYTGLTTISSGTLQLGDGTGGHDSTLASTGVAISNGAALIYNLSGSQTYARAISGSGGLTKNGNGTLLLSGNNNYTGHTTVNSGALEVANTGTLSHYTSATALTVNLARRSL